MDQLDLGILFENGAWQEPLFQALSRRGVSFLKIDLKEGAFGDDYLPPPRLYFSQASPSAYVRGVGRAVPFALTLMEFLEGQGARVLNGSQAFRFELSKFSQVQLMRRLGISHPRTVVFNDVGALRRVALPFGFPALLKPNQGGSGARMYKVNSVDEVAFLLETRPHMLLPDPILLLQEELIPRDPGHGIVRIEYLGRKFLYAMRVVSHGSFNLCPSEVCHPVSGRAEVVCEVGSGSPPEFYPYPDVPLEMIELGRTILQEAQIDVGAVEYLETTDGGRVIYDINANSNLRKPIGEVFGFDPFEKVVDFLVGELGRAPR